LDEVYLKIDGRLVYLWRAGDAEGEAPDVLVQSRQNKHAALKLMRELLKKYGVMPDKIVTDDLRSHGAAALELGISDHRSAGDGATIGRRIRISQPDEGRGKCTVSRAWDPRKDFSQRMQPPTTRSTSNAVSFRQEHAGLFELRPQTSDARPPLLREHRRQ
jgi:transposase-like protein